MKIVCEYCDNFIAETDEKCPSCGAVNPQYKRAGDGVPRTIYELKLWYTGHNLPPEEVTRFFIGQDYKGPKAFGIYQDGERFIVYKNKADGTRAVRYDGSDEAYAVNEIYMKLKEEIANQKAGQKSAYKPKTSGRSTVDMVRDERKKSKKLKRLIWIAVILLLIGGALSDDDGYYRYNDAYYYQNDNVWYRYDDATSTWNATEVDAELKDNAKDYYESYSYDDGYEISDFEDSSYYNDTSSDSSWFSDDSTWDSDSSWDDDSSWDSSYDWDYGGGGGSSSWDSDW